MSLTRPSPRGEADAERVGFSLVELLVVISIISLLMGMLLPAIQKVRSAANRTTCSNNLKQLALASHAYQTDYGTLPAGLYIYQDPVSFRSVSTTVFVALLPYIEQDTIYRQWDFTNPANNRLGGANARTAQVIPSFLCKEDVLQPSAFQLDGVADDFVSLYNRNVVYDGHYAGTSYVASGGSFTYYPKHSTAPRDGMFFQTGPWSNFSNKSPLRLEDVLDGLGNTLMFGEKYHQDPLFDQAVSAFGIKRYEYPIAQWSAWGWVGGFKGTGHVMASTRVKINHKVPILSDRPSYKDSRLSAFGSGHAHGANFSFGDGSVRFLKDSVDTATLKAIGTVKGGELVNGL